MPYFDHNMACNITDSNGPAKGGKVMRTVPVGYKQADEKPDEQIISKYKVDIDLRKLIFMRNLLKTEIENLKRQQGAYPIEKQKNLYETYSVNRNVLLLRGRDSAMYKAENKDYPNYPVMMRFYDAKVGIDPKNDMYLKFLRHLGKKHTSIVHTWEVFVDEKNNIEIFQEYCANGNLQKYTNDEKLKDEKEISLYAWQLLRGMDFLGDIGIAHREIHPKNLVLRPANTYNILKISNFRRSVVYWCVEENDVAWCPCTPASQQATDGPNFQAPETYGDPKTEQFDPIEADTWSYGAVIFYMATKGKYPYDPTVQSNKTGEEIQEKVKTVPLSDDGKELVAALLRVNALERMPIGFVSKSPWLVGAKKMKVTAKGVGSKTNVAGGRGRGKKFVNAMCNSKFFENPEMIGESIYVSASPNQNAPSAFVANQDKAPENATDGAKDNGNASKKENISAKSQTKSITFKTAKPITSNQLTNAKTAKSSTNVKSISAKSNTVGKSNNSTLATSTNNNFTDLEYPATLSQAPSQTAASMSSGSTSQNSSVSSGSISQSESVSDSPVSEDGSISDSNSVGTSISNTSKATSGSSVSGASSAKAASSTKSSSTVLSKSQATSATETSTKGASSKADGGVSGKSVGDGSVSENSSSENKKENSTKAATSSKKVSSKTAAASASSSRPKSAASVSSKKNSSAKRSTSSRRTALSKTDDSVSGSSNKPKSVSSSKSTKSTSSSKSSRKTSSKKS